MRALLFALLLLIPSGISAQTRWFEAPDRGFKISVPANYQSQSSMDGTDYVDAFVSPDESVAIRIRTVPLPGEVALPMIIDLFETNILAGAQRLILQDYELNGTPGQMAGYRWRYENIPVVVGAFYTQRDGRFHAVWSMIPENLYQARNGESDAILNTFAPMRAQAAALPSGIGGTVTPLSPPASIGGSVTPPSSSTSTGGSVTPPPSRPEPEAHPSAASRPTPSGYVILVEETAGLEFAIPEGFTQSSREQGQQIWQGPSGTEDADVRMVIQTIDKSPGDYSNVEEAYLTLMEQVRENPSATEVEKRRVRSAGALDVPLYSFDLRQGDRTTRFLYAIAETNHHITMVSFLGPVQRAYRQEIHAEVTAESMRLAGSSAPSAEASGPASPSSPPAASLRGPAGVHVAANLPASTADARQASSGYVLWGQNLHMRMERPESWTEVRNTGMTGYYRFGSPGEVNASFFIREIPRDRQTFEEVIAGGTDAFVGTVVINGTEYHAYQSVRNMGPPTNMNLRSDWLVWWHGRSTYQLSFVGDSRHWGSVIQPVAQHLLASLKMTWGG